ncbi:hypothetical protein [uncultured Mediterranean phage uvMED]|nr:hypothetical protein [uncultured Mediterranean phage uvMED]
MRSVQIYVEGMRLELFQDETISVNSSQQNINDISKVMTDYSQTFTIPASNNNNRIFEHFYESDIDGSLDHNIRRDATIEIDLVTFRKGKLSIEKSSLKNGQAESYAVTFYGETLALKDKFGDELLSDVSELSEDSFPYTPNNVLSAIQDDTVTPTKFPLITSRVLSYGDGSSTDISHTGSNAILTDELFPAINLKTFFDAIEDRYSVRFNGTFLEDDRFKKAYLYCKNSETFQFITKNTPFTFISSSEDTNNYNSLLTSSQYFNTTTNSLTLSHQTIDEMFPNVTPLVTTGGVTANYDYQVGGHIVKLNISNVSDTNETYYIDVLENGVLTRTIEGNDTQTTFVTSGANYSTNNQSLNNTFSFKVRATSSITLDIEVEYYNECTFMDTSLADVDMLLTMRNLKNTFRASSSISLPQSLDVVNYVPKMKVSDFFKGVLNLFNLTCYGQGQTNNIDYFQVEPIDDWYAKGGIIDITKHVDISDIEVNKVPLYKSISFNYKPSKSVTNKQFSSLFNREFGSTSTQFDYDGGEYKIDLPFENLMFNKFTDTNLQVGFNVDSNLAPYTPEPTILYMYDSLSADFKVNDGDLGTTNLLTSYTPFGQDVSHNGTPRSLNFSADYSTLLLQPSQNNLFSDYYFPYLSNLYNLKNRNVKVKTVLPVSILSTLQLNDRLIIRNKRYIINSMSTNLTTGEVNFDLLHDFRAVISETTSGGGGTLEPLLPDLSAQCLDVRILFPRDVVSATITGVGVSSITPSTITEEQSIVVCIPANDSSTGLILTEDGLFNLALEDGNGDDVLQEEGDGSGSIIPYVLTITYTFADGSQSSSQQVIIQQP